MAIRNLMPRMFAFELCSKGSADLDNTQGVAWGL